MHTCNECGKQFKRKVYLRNHIQKNICDKYKTMPFECKLCNKRYSLKKTLAQHIKNKHKTRDPKLDVTSCLMCNKKFSSKSNMKRHIKNGQCPIIKGNKGNVSIVNNNDNSVNIHNNNINNNFNITIDFGKEKLDDWIEDVGRKIVDKCLRDLNGLPINLLEAKHVLSKRNMNVYLPSEEDKYKNSLVYSNGWKEMKTSKMIDKMLIGVANDIYDMITNDTKYKLRLSKKLKEELDKKISVIQSNKYLQGPTANMLLKNRELLGEHYNKTHDDDE
jgi:hypothetical protein